MPPKGEKVPKMRLWKQSLANEVWVINSCPFPLTDPPGIFSWHLLYGSLQMYTLKMIPGGKLDFSQQQQQQPILWTASHLRSTSTTPALTSREDARVHECGHTEVSQNKQEDDSIVDRHSDWETLWEPRAAVTWTETTVLTLQGSVTLYGSAGMSLTLWAQEDKPTCWSYKLRIAITR